MDSTENSADTGRRSTRIRAQILVRVTSLDPATPFSESGHTLVVNTQGCGVRLSRALEPGLAVSLDDLPAGSVTARIANCVPLGSGGQWWMVGIALDEPGNVWGIHPTPADWGSDAANCRCGRRNRIRRKPSQERRMALPPILQPRRIPPRQKIARWCVGCGVGRTLLSDAVDVALQTPVQFLSPPSNADEFRNLENPSQKRRARAPAPHSYQFVIEPSGRK